VTSATSTSVTSDRDWWRQAVVYQIYPRSFADANGDGIGDLRGIIDHAGHLVRLGVDAVWLSPFYPSALADGGYDVDDYRAVAPELGTLGDFDELVSVLHGAGIKLIVDIVPNHTSNRHAWFREALASPSGSAARNRYVIRRGNGPDGSEPPTDWRSFFGGPAWEPIGDGDWYLHLFAPEQPDLNWANPEVRADFLTTLRFWSDRGVDGFRIDVAHLLVKDASVIEGVAADLPTQERIQAGFPDGEHPFEGRDEVHEIYRTWRAVFDEYDPPRMAVAEAWVAAHRRVAFARPDGLGQAFNFDLLLTPWDAAAFT
jgi:alpha-glucosidase